MKIMHVGTNSYGDAICDADARFRRGERQVYCGVHGLWHWPDQVQTECAGHTYTLAGFRRMIAESTKIAEQMEAKHTQRDARKRSSK